MSTIYICIIVLAVFFAVTQRASAIKARNDLRQYADRMESAELDLHAIRSVATNRLHDTGPKLKAMVEKPDYYFLESLADDLIEVQHIVETRGPATIGGRPYWKVEPQENNYQYGEQYPMFPE